MGSIVLKRKENLKKNLRVNTCCKKRDYPPFFEFLLHTKQQLISDRMLNFSFHQ